VLVQTSSLPVIYAFLFPFLVAYLGTLIRSKQAVHFHLFIFPALIILPYSAGRMFWQLVQYLLLVLVEVISEIISYPGYVFTRLTNAALVKTSSFVHLDNLGQLLTGKDLFVGLL